MRILALSDAYDWEDQKELVDRYKPTVTALAGDLTSDGHAAFWRKALETLPEFRRSREAIRRRFGVTRRPGSGIDVIPGREADAFHQAMARLEYHHRKTKAFLAARKLSHVDRFYDFLAFAGKVSTVLVVKGDHDDDFAGDYSSRRMNRIPGCREVSGKSYDLDGCFLLGLGYEQCGLLRSLRRLIAEFRDRVDVVIAHAPQRNVRLLAELRPRVLIRGHFGGGRYMIDGVPSVFTSYGHAIIDLPRKGLPRISAAGHQVWEHHLIHEYPWLQPYPPVSTKGSRTPDA